MCILVGEYFQEQLRLFHVCTSICYDHLRTNKDSTMCQLNKTKQNNEVVSNILTSDMYLTSLSSRTLEKGQIFTGLETVIQFRASRLDFYGFSKVQVQSTL